MSSLSLLKPRQLTLDVVRTIVLLLYLIRRRIGWNIVYFLMDVNGIPIEKIRLIFWWNMVISEVGQSSVSDSHCLVNGKSFPIDRCIFISLSSFINFPEVNTFVCIFPSIVELTIAMRFCISQDYWFIMNSNKNVFSNNLGRDFTLLMF